MARATSLPAAASAPDHPPRQSPQPEVTKEEDTSSEVLSDGGGGETVGEAGPIPTKRRKAVHKMNMNFYGAGGGDHKV